ncbi:MAG: asparaginase [Candidatus Sericytochromatia bacterium]|nr:asparaginase [Candidatus Sericytochromatia bacterium]
MQSKILVEVERNGIVESVHRGWVAVCDSKGELINGTHKTFPNVFFRSSLKPIQALPFLFSKGMETFKFGLRELAIICSSHSGEEIHTSIVKHILDTIGLDQSYLKCGTHIPYSSKVANKLIIDNQEPSLLQCNCSGKHSAMLAACLINSWDLKNYHEYDHPLQKSVREHLGNILDIDSNNLKWGIDGCGIPTYVLPLDKLAQIFARITNAENNKNEYMEHFLMIREAFLNFPYVIAGHDRVDTVMMQALPTRFLSKIGGEAILGFSSIKEKINLAIKIEDGINRPMIPTIIKSLKNIGLNIDSIPTLHDLETTNIYNNDKKIVGKVKPVVKFVY